MTGQHQEESGMAMVPVDEAARRAAVELVPPGISVQRGIEIANELMELVNDPKRHMTVEIHGKRHPNASAWTTLANMAHLTVRTVHHAVVTEGTYIDVVVGKDQNRRAENIELVAYEATVEISDRNGIVVASAVATAGTDEGPSLGQKGWGKRNAALAFAQTRASCRALKHYLGWIPALAGLETTPAEEMDGSDYGPHNEPAAQQPSRGRQPRQGQQGQPRQGQPQQRKQPRNSGAAKEAEGDRDYHELLSKAMLHASKVEDDMATESLLKCFSDVKAAPRDVAEALGVDDQGNVLKTVEKWIGGDGYDPAEVEVEGGRTNIGAARTVIKFLFMRETTRLNPQAAQATEAPAEQDSDGAEKEVVEGEVVNEEPEPQEGQQRMA